MSGDANPETRLLQDLCSDLGIEKEEFGVFLMHYDTGFESYGNEIYDDIKSRLVHLFYFLNKSWWNGRLEHLFSYYSNYDEVIDIGFSVPYLPLRAWQQSLESGKLSRLPHLLYVDLNDTSERLANMILPRIGASADFVTGNVELEDTWKRIAAKISTQENAKEGSLKKLFCAFETVEHMEHPEKFWQNLSREHKGSDMALSLPVGPGIPSHHLVHEDLGSALAYARRYVDIREYKLISPPPDVQSNFNIFICIGAIL